MNELMDSPVGRVYSNDVYGQDMGIDQPQVDDFKQTLANLGKYIEQLYYAFEGSSTRSKIMKLVKDSRRAYYTEVEKTNFPWNNASNMITPLTTMGVDELEPRLAAAVIGREPYIKAKSCIGVSTKEEADAITKFDNFILEHKVQVKKLRRLVPDPQTGQMTKTEDEVVWQGPQVTLCPVEFVWHGDDIEDDEWDNTEIIRYVRNITVGELIKRAQSEDGWILPDDLQRYQTSVGTHKTTQQESEMTGDYDYVKNPNQRPIEFYEAYLKYSLDGETDVDLIVLCEVNSFDVFRVRERIDVVDENVCPLRRMRFLKRKGISWGYPLYTLIAGIQLGVDAMWNRCINSADITMTPWGFVKRGLSGLRKNKVEVYPGNMIEVDNPEAINFPNLSRFQPAQFVPLILQYISFFERTLNVSDFMQGRESQLVGKKGSTATGTLAILQEGKVKFEYRGGLTHNEYLDLFKTIHDLCVSNMPIEDMIKICGQPITKYSTAEEYAFLLVGSDLTSNRFVDRQETESFIATMQPFWSMINPIAVLQDLLMSYEKEETDYINPELMQMVQQWMMIQKNQQEIAAMGIPPEMAKAAAEQGYTAENVAEFVKAAGREAGRAQFAPPEEEESSGGT